MFRSKIKVGLVVVALSFLNACASGSAIVTGVKRPALDFNQVRLYLEAPEQYETIGIVKASSDAGITQQASQDYAVEELKKQAAKIGANGVILTTTGERTSSIISTNADGSIYTIPVSAQTVSGKAVFVTE
ncbi:hypothetical protein [Vibrio vulnificus]|uniref:hypothetical protein n=1 Tax=Vibrio vulnificus TaxID=672 RepID=UPI0005F18DEE|nr:hypothetical protein [Vibrio vulnificus]EGR0059039.1 hypothetical protein [Vibrio vulnificus]EHH1191948.1 hypothetical protein [Vibrio vulnificus]EIA1305091.1 hypothetical protein [Vibrio vulnificus]EIV8483801.1 hypothetical protein [Vibrio vulnificus]MCU8116019.1 hypothetical protein [Vibrio vulnificus]